MILFTLIFILTYSLIALKGSYMINTKFSTINNMKSIILVRNKIFSLIDKAQLKTQFKVITPNFLIFSSLMLFCISFGISIFIFKSKITCLILAAPTIFIPYIILNFLIERKNMIIENNLINFLIQLKNHVKVTNNIVDAFKRVKTVEPIQKNIDIFNQNISRGTNIYKCFEDMKDSFEIKNVKHFITLLKYCMISGGDAVNLIEKYQALIGDVIYEKQKRKQDTLYARIVLIIFIIMDILMIYFYIFKNPVYSNIVNETFMGTIIINANIAVIYILIYMIIIINKLDY